MASYKEYTDTLTAEADTVMAANTGRRGLIFGNPSDTAMTLRFGAVASATAGIPVGAGESVSLIGRDCPDSSVSAYCAGTSKAYTAYEW